MCSRYGTGLTDWRDYFALYGLCGWLFGWLMRAVGVGYGGDMGGV